MKTALIQNLKAAMHRHNLNAIELSRQAGFKPSFVYDILSGKSANPSTARLAKLAEILGISLADLLGLKSPAMPHPASDQYVAISSILVATSAADGHITLEEKHSDPYYFRKSWVDDRLNARPNDLRMIFVEGDSMEPTLCQGDKIIVDISRRNPSPPGIFVLFDGFGLVVKRLEFLSNSNPPSLRILSDNPQYLPYERAITEANIIGRVVWFAREI